MKRESYNIKKIIKRRIKLSKQTKMNERNKIRTSGKSKPIDVGLVNRNEIRRGENSKKPIEYNIKDYGSFIKSENVDYDVLIYISSFNRYDKLIRILKQLYSQETDYSFKIIIMNDASNDKRYNYLKNKFPNIIYLKNKINGGRKLYWKTTNTIFNELKKYTSHTIIQIDDDFILCNDFINILVDNFFKLKLENNSYMLFKYHFGVLDNNVINENIYFNPKLRFQDVDGGTMFDFEFFKLINFKIEDTEKWMKYGGSGVWNYLNDKIKELGVMVYSFKKSLVFHDGNDYSVMHPEARLKRKYNTINYINNERKSK